MHQKKSDVQIGKESSGVSSDFNPTPPLLPLFHQKNIQNQTILETKLSPRSHNSLRIEIPDYPLIQSPPQPLNLTTKTTTSSSNQTQIQLYHESIKRSSSKTTTLLSTPHKRSIMNNPLSSSLSHSPTLSSLAQHPSSSSPSSFPLTRTAVFHHFRHIRRFHIHLRFLFLLSLPSLYYFLSIPHRWFFLDFLSVLAFSGALLISVNLALPRLPSIRLLLARSFPLKLSSSSPTSHHRPPVLWSIGSKPKTEKRINSGSWVQVYSNGDVYEGEFHQGKSSGSGVYYYYMSGRYEGDWVDEKYDGYGVETWARGSRYRGQYRQGLRHGFGVYRFYTGDVYAGEWSNGQSHGCGVHTCEDGSRYVGEFKWGVKHGLGHYHFRNGDIYAGEYFADKMHGFGVYNFANGHRYEGAWHEGRRQGLGMYTFRNGEAQSGHWQNGVLDVPSTQNTHPGSPFAVNHTKVINSVQEARRASEKAYDVGRVDERVNKAVSLANKAANAARVAAVKAVQRKMHHNNKNGDLPISIV